MPETINYSDGSQVRNAVPVIWDDLSVEAPGYYRAFWADGPDGTGGSPVFGYCDSRGSHRTIKAVAAEVARYYPGEVCYRNGRPVKL